MLKKRCSKVILFGFLAVIMAFSVLTADLGASILLGDVKTVYINVDGEVTKINTRKSRVGDILEQAGIEIYTEDYINTDLDEQIEETVNNINIRKAIPIKVITADETIEFHTSERTVKNAIIKQGIDLSEQDRLHDNFTTHEISEYETVTEDMEIRVIDVCQKVIEEDTPLPYEVVTKENYDLEKGKNKVVQPGQHGVKKATYNAVLEDGEVVSKVLISEEVVTKPVNEIKEVGMQVSFMTERGIPVPYKDSVVYQATAYCADSDPYNGMTATGVWAKPGIVAVDPKVIPLGTKLYVESLGAMKDYGYCVAADTGVRGERIDLYFNTLSECYTFGRRNVKIYILKDQSIDVFKARK